MVRSGSWQGVGEILALKIKLRFLEPEAYVKHGCMHVRDHSREMYGSMHVREHSREMYGCMHVREHTRDMCMRVVC